MRRPAPSSLALTLPVRLRRVASGLMIESVRSRAMGPAGLKKRGLITAAPARDKPSARPLPAPRIGLAEILERVAGVLGRLPARARRGQRRLVAPGEELAHRRPRA